MNEMTTPADATLASLRVDFRRTSTLEMPVAGLILWGAAAVAGLFLPDRAMAAVVAYGSGMIFPFAWVLGRMRGRNILAGGTTNPLTGMFLSCLAMVVLLWPFIIIAGGFAPLLVVLGGAIIMGIIWIPYGWAAEDPIGLKHAIGRTAACLAAYLFTPEPYKASAICAAVVLAYAVSLPLFRKD